MIIFYPPKEFNCTPVAICDMTDSSDRWSPTEIMLAAYQNIPDNIDFILQPKVFSCKYSYDVQHNGIPLGAGLKMTLSASIETPPADLIAQISVGFVSSAKSIEDMESALSVYANPEFKIMTAVVVERGLSRSFVAYTVKLQPNSYGNTVTLYIKGASIGDSLIMSALGFQLDKLLPLSTQIQTLASKFGYTCIFDTSVMSLIPVNGRLFQPTTLTKILDEICLQNKLIYMIKGKVISFYKQTTEPFVTLEDVQEFSFLGYAGKVIWGVGIENYSNLKFKTTPYDISLYDKITVYNDGNYYSNKKSIASGGAGLFTGLNMNPSINPIAPDSYDFFVIRYSITRNNSELCAEITASNNWIMAQMRVDGILESKIFEGKL